MFGPHFENRGPSVARSYAGWGAICTPTRTPTKGRRLGNLRLCLIGPGGRLRCSDSGKYSAGARFRLRRARFHFSGGFPEAPRRGPYVCRIWRREPRFLYRARGPKRWSRSISHPTERTTVWRPCAPQHRRFAVGNRVGSRSRPTPAVQKPAPCYSALGVMPITGHAVPDVSAGSNGLGVAAWRRHGKR